MPQVKQQRSEQVFLPSYTDDNDPGWIKMLTNVPGNSLISIEGVEGNIRQALQLIQNNALDWNLFDENNNKIPITVENIGKYLYAQDIAEVVAVINLPKTDLEDDKKKATNNVLNGGTKEGNTPSSSATGVSPI